MSAEIKLFDSELKIMEALWENGDMRAGELVKILNQKYGWNRNSTYSILKKCIEKGAVERTEPHFMCKSLVTREQVGHARIEEMLSKVFKNSLEDFFSCFFNHVEMTEEEVETIKEMIDEMEMKKNK